MRSLYLLFLSVVCTGLWAQKSPSYFQPVSPDAVVLPETAERELEPFKYTAYTVDFEALTAQLNAAPQEYSDAAKQKPCLVTLPTADGAMETFTVVKTSPIAAELAAKHPEIITLAGASTKHSGMLIRITVTPSWGLRAMIFFPDRSYELIQPIALNQNRYYMAYNPIYAPKSPLEGQLKTTVDFKVDLSNLKEQTGLRYSPGAPSPENGKLLDGAVVVKKYRFACGCTGEFSQANGGTKDAVFQKVTTVVNSLNAIYERDINIRLELIPESYDIIFLDPTTDPYPGTTVGEWLDANPAAMIGVLGTDTKYDLGHVFAKYITGAAIGVAGGTCCTQSKGRGCSATYNNALDPFFFTVVGQEIGHMWSGGHTFNQCNIGDQFNYNSACEPGSGSTIMSYNGSCGSNNISGGNILYYHACSIAEIRNFVEHDLGATCGMDITTTNNDPIASTSYPDNFFIPISTPFELTGTGYDPDGDALTYCWDEKDLGPTTTLGNPVGDSPLFRYFAPTSNPTRTFPRIQNVINNQNNVEEVLPTYNRNISFVFVVRDDVPGGGGIGYDTVEMQSTTSAGPFRLSYPNLASTIWHVGEYQTVTWDVANTDNNLVNCHKVNIRLSTDGGLTYPVTLATAVPNVGSTCVLVPDNAGTKTRIRVEAADNVFFDISNANFAIQQASAPGFAICPGTFKDKVCLPSTFSTVISSSAIGGFSTPVEYSLSGLPNGASAIFSPNPVTAGQESTLTITLPADSPEATYDLVVQATAGASTTSATISLNTIRNDFSGVAPVSPAYGATGVNTKPLLNWSTAPDADAYDVQLATNPSFSAASIVTEKANATTGSFQVSTELTEGGVYFWRVRPKNGCGNGPWSNVQVFVVSVLSCVDLAANDVPISISPNGTPTVESKINLLAGGQISDVNVKKVAGYHDFFKDLEVHLISPAGTDVLLWKDRCGSSAGNFSIAFDDGAASTFSCPPPTSTPSSRPSGLLSNFNGQDATGTWILRVKDNAISSGGNISAFELRICSNEATNPPLIVVNNALLLQAGANAGVDAAHLKAEDPNNTAAQLTFTLIDLPQHGALEINGAPAQVGDHFSQADIDNGLVRYYDWGWNQGQDQFHFVVSDGEGGIATGVFVISPNTVGTHELVQGQAFNLSPNPAHEQLQLSLAEPLQSEALVTVYNAAGQRLKVWTLGTGATSLTLQVGELPEGVYTVALQNEQGRSVKKVVLH